MKLVKIGALLHRLTDFEKGTGNHNQLICNGTFVFEKDVITAAGQNRILDLVLRHLQMEVKHDQH
ncbi:hypothetical protein BCT31_01865 [Vibrio lentus]|uniref:hypothetical protein n=1 Tax=Vibrio lentus TaxID=136468 RepID=UPI000CC6CB9E|nr:hypothetical protein [Vibrio lentus]PMN54322.1 hypothetical protein BCT31_01865 [Vibrio lentus]